MGEAFFIIVVTAVIHFGIFLVAIGAFVATERLAVRFTHFSIRELLIAITAMSLVFGAVAYAVR